MPRQEALEEAKVKVEVTGLGPTNKKLLRGARALSVLLLPQGSHEVHFGREINPSADRSGAISLATLRGHSAHSSRRRTIWRH